MLWYMVPPPSLWFVTFMKRSFKIFSCVLLTCDTRDLLVGLQSLSWLQWSSKVWHENPKVPGEAARWKPEGDASHPLVPNPSECIREWSVVRWRHMHVPDGVELYKAECTHCLCDNRRPQMPNTALYSLTVFSTLSWSTESMSTRNLWRSGWQFWKASSNHVKGPSSAILYTRCVTWSPAWMTFCVRLLSDFAKPGPWLSHIVDIRNWAAIC